MDVKIIVSKGEAEDQRMVWAEVYAPNRPDADGEYMTADTIREMAYDFSRKLKLDQVDVQHGGVCTPGVQIVETFIARKGDPDFIEGSWVVGIHINDDALWASVKKGELNGLSVEALVQADPEGTEVDMEVPPVVSGMTSKSEDHQHQFFVTYNDNGQYMGGTTDMVNGHKHAIHRGTLTEAVNGHAHTFSSVDDLKILH